MANLFDSANAPEGVPEEIFIGDFIQFKLTEYSNDYPNTAHTMRFVARISTGGSTLKSLSRQPHWMMIICFLLHHR